VVITEGAESRVVGQNSSLPADVGVSVRPSRDLQQTFRLLLATVWLMDAALQLQPFFFTAGNSGFSGMLNGVAPGNPTWIAHTITWNASSVVQHQPILTNTIFAGIQFLIAFGIAWRRTVRPALVLSIVWSLGVWWFGEGFGGLFHGAATPLGGGPGAVLFYALLAVLLWPSKGPNAPFVAARTIGVRAAKAVWLGVWLLLALLSVVGNGRSPQFLQGLVASLDNSRLGWLTRLDRWTEAVLLHHGSTVAVLLALFCVIVAASVYLPPKARQVILAVAVVTFAVVWVGVEDVGGILAGGATDPNSGPVVILLLLSYWPLSRAGIPAVDGPDEFVGSGASKEV
jgi:hypothetical protein